MLASLNNENQIGQSKMHLSLVDSTNNYAANMLKSGNAESGTVILADEQTNGRGQRGETWQSLPGMNLQMSVIWMPKNMLLDNQKHLNFAVSLAILQALKSKGIAAEIKWPNDILVEGKKICGVLIENQLKGNLISSCIIGIGLNVNQTDFSDFPATSMNLELKERILVHEVLDTLLYKLNQTLNQLVHADYSSLETAYYQALLGYKKPRAYTDSLGEFIGVIQGVNANGHLLMERENELKSYGIKELKFIL